LPLLTLQVDLFHHGKNDDADHKVVYERLLNLAVPPDSEGKGVKLEDCLEEYFNSQVDVLREGLDEKKIVERSDSTLMPNPLNVFGVPKSTIRVVELENSQASTPQPFPDADPLSLQQLNPVMHDLLATDIQPNPDSQSSVTRSQSVPRPNRSRTESIIQRVVLEKQEQPSDADTANLFQRAKRTASVVKAVTIPAWQFFKLIRTSSCLDYYDVVSKLIRL
jgi:hypothetical protein